MFAPIERALESRRQIAEADQWVQAARFAQQQVEQHPGDHQQGNSLYGQPRQHARALSSRGRPATISTALSHWAASAWLRRPCSSVKRRETAPIGVKPSPTSFDTSTMSPALPASASIKLAHCASNWGGRVRSPISGYAAPPLNIRLVSHRVRQSTINKR